MSDSFARRWTIALRKAEVAGNPTFEFDGVTFSIKDMDNAARESRAAIDRATAEFEKRMAAESKKLHVRVKTSVKRKNRRGRYK